MDVCNYASCLNPELCERKQQISTNIWFEQNTKGKGHYELVRLSHANVKWNKTFILWWIFSHWGEGYPTDVDAC